MANYAFIIGSLLVMRNIVLNDMCMLVKYKFQVYVNITFF